jgi:hypothetical protein
MGPRAAISSLMKLGSPLRRWVLPILLAAAPLQAQTFMLCSSPDLGPVTMTAHDAGHSDECCCHDPQPARDCDDAGNHAAPRPSEDCCDEIVSLSYVPDEQSDVVKPAAPRGDPEPTKAVAPLQSVPQPPSGHIAAAPRRACLPWTANGSRLYLLTERVRI